MNVASTYGSTDIEITVQQDDWIEIDAPDILDRAKRITRKERQKEYGHPMVNFLRMAIQWTMYIQVKAEKAAQAGKPLVINPGDVAWMMTMSKTARQIETHKDDNADDTVGYMVCFDQIIRYMENVLDYDDAVEGLENMTMAEMGRLVEKIVIENI